MTTMFWFISKIENIYNAVQESSHPPLVGRGPPPERYGRYIESPWGGRRPLISFQRYQWWLSIELRRAYLFLHLWICGYTRDVDIQYKRSFCLSIPQKIRNIIMVWIIIGASFCDDCSQPYFLWSSHLSVMIASMNGIFCGWKDTNIHTM